MGLKNMLTSKWFTRLVLVSWIVSAISILFVFKNVELIVHGQLYDFGLVFSPEWADGFRVLTWMIFVCAGVPMALSGVALASSFLNGEEIQEHVAAVSRRAGPPRGVTKANSPTVRPTQQTRQVQQPVKEPVTRVDIGNCVGISCPECKKVFGRALVMLDFRSGSNRMISVCPYCNAVLGHTDDEKHNNESVYVDTSDKTLMQ
jgi:hypothetical protein